MLQTLLILVASFLFGSIFVVVKAIEDSKASNPDPFDTNEYLTTFVLGFFLWPIAIPTFTIFSIFCLVRLILIYALFKPVHKMAERRYDRPSIKKGDDPFVEKAKQELKELGIE